MGEPTVRREGSSCTIGQQQQHQLLSFGMGSNSRVAHETNNDNMYYYSTSDAYLQNDSSINYCDEVEVIVPPFPFVHYDTDHSYISSSHSCNSVVENPKFNVNDCISISQDSTTTAVSELPEFRELFDLYPYDLIREHEMGIDLQEQVIESSQSQHASQNHDGLQSSSLVQNSRFDNSDSNSFYATNIESSLQLNSPQPLPPSASSRQGQESEVESGDYFEEDDEDDSSSESDMESQIQNKQQQRQKSPNSKRRKNTSDCSNSSTSNNNHHVGPFPHTFITTASDRRMRFSFGLQTIVTKIKALMSRTGASADFRAEFEGNVFTLDNADSKLYTFSHRHHKKVSNGGNNNIINSNSQAMNDDTMTNDSQSALVTSGGQDDHRYAATILTQTESSKAVRDHQYNEVSTTNNIERNSIGKVGLIEKTYIRTRYARERWLKSSVKTIYTKMQRLINRTGARMKLCIEYLGIVITQRNYKELESLLEKGRLKLKKFNAAILVEKNKSHLNNFISNKEHGETTRDIVSSSGQVSSLELGRESSSRKHIGQETIMKISIPSSSKQKRVAMNCSDKAMKIEFIKVDKVIPDLSNSIKNSSHNNGNSNKNSPQILQTIIKSDHDYVESSSTLKPSGQPINNNSGEQQATNNSNNFTSLPLTLHTVSNHSNSLDCDIPEFYVDNAIVPASSVDHVEEILISEEAADSHGHHHISTPSTDNNKNVVVKAGTTRTVDAFTSTDQPLQQQQQPSCQICGDKSVKIHDKYPLWIRCGYPICQYLVHPSCLGFSVMNFQQLQFLPPYFCPAHRENIVFG